jgi:hypothetical protein
MPLHLDTFELCHIEATRIKEIAPLTPVFCPKSWIYSKTMLEKPKLFN